jgi:hypothetical protein
MANNYCFFSAEITNLTAKELAWISKKYIEAKEKDADGELIADFLIEVGPPGAPNSVIFYADESGTPENVADFVQAFLRKFRQKGCFTLEWANTCSSPRPGEFGGGAVFVTAKNQQWINTGEWAANQEKLWRKKRG